VDLEKRSASANVLERHDDRPIVSFDFKSRQSWGQILTPIGFVLSLTPIMSSGAALFLGVSLAFIVGNPYIDRTRKLTKPMLAWSIVGLGAGVNLMMVLKAGMDGLLFTMVSLSVTLFVGYWIGRLFKTSNEMSALINVGTAICGGSAIAAVSSVIRAKDESISVSLGVVFILNAIALFIFPGLGHFFGLTEAQFGLWGALAIHDTSSVVGATMQYGQQALEVGTTVKLVRALWIIPVSFLFARFFVSDSKAMDEKEKPAPRQYPWFIGGFVLMSALITSLPQLKDFGHGVEWMAKRVLVATLFLIGSGLTVATLKKVGLKTFLHGVTLWILVAGASLISIAGFAK
jgi:uncharacterized integral membrane protein (TIGR00698 family)